MGSIGENTKFTFGVVVVLIALTAWLTEAHYQGEDNAKDIRDLQKKQMNFNAMQVDVAVIREQVTQMRSQMTDINRKFDEMQR